MNLTGFLISINIFTIIGMIGLATVYGRIKSDRTPKTEDNADA